MPNMNVISDQQLQQSQKQQEEGEIVAIDWHDFVVVETIDVPADEMVFTLALELLMEDSYKKLRAALYDTQEEFDRFLQLCINCVMPLMSLTRISRFSEKTDGTRSLLHLNPNHDG